MPRRIRRFRRRVVNIQTKRPIDKALVTCSLNLTGASSAFLNILPPAGSAGVAFPGTVTGIRWIAIYKSNSAQPQVSNCIWVLVKVREGLNPNPVVVSSAPAPFYNPEQDVICWGMMGIQGVSAGSGGRVTYDVNEGSTKAMRKLMAGDRIALVAQDNSNESNYLDFTVQLFYKT